MSVMVAFLCCCFLLVAAGQNVVRNEVYLTKTSEDEALEKSMIMSLSVLFPS